MGAAIVFGEYLSGDRGYFQGLKHGLLIGIVLGLLLAGAALAAYYYHLALARPIAGAGTATIVPHLGLPAAPTPRAAGERFR